MAKIIIWNIMSLDGRFEGGVSLGRFDLRGGLRMLKQEPDQSFFGPTASITMRF